MPLKLVIIVLEMVAQGVTKVGDNITSDSVIK